MPVVKLCFSAMTKLGKVLFVKSTCHILSSTGKSSSLISSEKLSSYTGFIIIMSSVFLITTFIRRIILGLF